jgi:hypothetical protein
MTPSLTVLARVPKFPAAAGTLIASTPPVIVTVAEVGSADAGKAVPSITNPTATTKQGKDVLIGGSFF